MCKALSSQEAISTIVPFTVHVLKRHGGIEKDAVFRASLPWTRFETSLPHMYLCDFEQVVYLMQASVFSSEKPSMYFMGLRRG